MTTQGHTSDLLEVSNWALYLLKAAYGFEDDGESSEQTCIMALTEAITAASETAAERDRLTEEIRRTELAFAIEQAECVRLKAINADLLEALQDIAKGEGPYSRDQLKHAENVIEQSISIAEAAIAKATSRP